jgi:hypothetical protein
MRPWLPLLLLPLAGSLVGCTAARASYLLVDAQKRYAEAVAEGAVERAPYEAELARVYLDKAKEELNGSDYGASERMSRKAAEAATAAYDKVADDGRPELRGNTDAIVPEERLQQAPVKTSDDALDIDLDAP